MEERIFCVHQQAGHAVAVAVQVGPNAGTGATGAAPAGAGGANANAKLPKFRVTTSTRLQSIRIAWDNSMVHC